MQDKLEYFKKLVNKYLRKVLKPSSNKIYHCMRYAVFPGGKRIRPLLTLATAHTCGISPKKVLPVAAAIELIHCYSLVHDDLPSMDNDDYRRGKLTVHKKFSEGLAVLTGDALLTKAFDLLSLADESKQRKSQAKKNLQVINFISKSIGADGMISGQVADTFISKSSSKEGINYKKNLLNYIHLNKTAKLIQGSVIAPAIIAGVKSKKFNALQNYAKKIGLAFQIIDDIFDKSQDSNSKQLAYSLLYGIKESKKKAHQLVKEAKNELTVFGKRAKLLREIADYVVQRKN
ncbi:MAG: polyprenyl synthetase family protein [Elusimicrobiota bacterium]|nr:polyprenyl synthetase family protein [Elusimicrobiota bacterium]